MEKRLDIVCVGGANVDVFVDAAKNEFRRHGKHPDICYPLGEKILVNHITFDVGGGALNTAVAFSRLGLMSGCVAALGDDESKEIVMRRLNNEKVEFLGKIKEGNTGYSIILTTHGERTILVYKGVNNELEFNNFSNINAGYFYFSTMTGKSFDSLVSASRYCLQKGIGYAFNPSMYVAEKGLSYLKKVLEGCDVLILNKEESFALTKKHDINHALKMLKDNIANNGVVVITDGASGAYSYDGYIRYYIKPRKVKVIETTGAGDAFASGFVYGRLKMLGMEVCMNYGMQEAESVIQAIGAQTNLLKKFSKVNYKLEKKKL